MKKCSKCGGNVTKNFVKSHGRYWHRSCFVCSHCQRSFSGKTFFLRDGKPFHERCYHKKFSYGCSVCGGLIHNTTYKIDVWGNTFHAHHTQELPSCFSCGRLICQRLTHGGVSYSDKRTVCTDCRSSSVDKAADGRKTNKQVFMHLSKIGMDLQRCNLPLRLVTLEEMNNFSGRRHGRSSTGMCRVEKVTANGKIVRRDVREIMILFGLPEEQYSTVLVHELTHAWLFLNCIDDLPGKVEEGLATLNEYLWLKNQATDIAAFRIQMLKMEKDPIYGRGFREAIDGLSLTGSLVKLIAFVHQNKRFPRKK